MGFVDILPIVPELPPKGTPVTDGSFSDTPSMPTMPPPETWITPETPTTTTTTISPVLIIIGLIIMMGVLK